MQLQLHNSRHHEAGLVLKGKNLLLWKELMQETGHNDSSLFNEVVRFELRGQSPASQEFPQDGYVPPQQSVESLKARRCG